MYDIHIWWHQTQQMRINCAWCAVIHKNLQTNETPVVKLQFLELPPWNGRTGSCSNNINQRHRNTCTIQANTDAMQDVKQLGYCCLWLALIMISTLFKSISYWTILIYALALINITRAVENMIDRCPRLHMWCLSIISVQPFISNFHNGMLIVISDVCCPAY